MSTGDYFADGRGSSKQQAKHNAAQLLIDVLKDKKEDDGGPAGQLEDAIKTLSCPQENLIGFNAVGTLTDFCITKNYPEAVYNLVRDEGPPHARIFTYKCTVSNLTELGTARTKKQAKHQSAYSMLVRLKNMCGEEINAVVKVSEKPPSPKKDFQKQDNEATETYLRVTKSKRSAANSSFVADQYRSYVALLEKSPTIARIATNESYEKQPLQTLQTIADELGIELDIRSFNGKTSGVVFVRLLLSPVLSQGGSTVETAALRALRSLLSLL